MDDLRIVVLIVVGNSALDRLGRSPHDRRLEKSIEVLERLERYIPDRSGKSVLDGWEKFVQRSLGRSVFDELERSVLKRVERFVLDRLRTDLDELGRDLDILVRRSAHDESERSLLDGSVRSVLDRLASVSKPNSSPAIDFSDAISSVVSISIRNGEQAEVQFSGSGCIWNKHGHTVTNHHVIDNASEIWVTINDQTTYKAKVVGSFPALDVAVLRVDAPNDKLRPIHVGVSAHLLVGQKVFVIGNPFGTGIALSTGVISRLHGEISSPTGYLIPDAIQTDAAINPGNSGGPLFDSSGSLIGIITTICSPSGASCGVGLSISIDTVVGIVNQLLKHGTSDLF